MFIHSSQSINCLNFTNNESYLSTFNSIFIHKIHMTEKYGVGIIPIRIHIDRYIKHLNNVNI